MAEASPQTVLAGRYALHEELGRGGMATVWRATDEVLDRPVAVKILHQHLAEDPVFRRRFNSEALAAARLTHPNIVNVFDTGDENGVSFIVMEFFSGITLAELIRRERRLSTERAVAIMVPVLAALQCAHEAGVVHRDVKPANILVGDGGIVKVMDLGLARAAYASADVTTTGAVLGSVPYLSPEQVQGSDVDERSDVYACGVVLYEMLTGRRPFSAENDLGAAMMRLTRDPPPPRSLVAGIPRAVEAVVLRAMSRRPEDRYPSAENMAAALVRLRLPAPAGPPTVHEPAPLEEDRAGGFRSWMLVPLLAVLLAAVAIVAGLLLGGLQLGGPLGIQAGGSEDQQPPPETAAYRFAGVTAFDPQGDGGEHDELVPNVTDGDPGTVWYTENYHQLDLAPKDGVGLLFDLGSPRAVDGFVLRTTAPGFHFEIRVGDDPAALESASGPEFTAQESMREQVDEVTGRYVLVWITSVVPGVEGGNRAAIGEFKALGPGG